MPGCPQVSELGDPQEGGLRYSTLTMHSAAELLEEIENEADLAD